jgi:hypothetical protein
MATIDWHIVGFSALWIIGLSLNLVSFSMADYQQAQTGKRLREVWATQPYRAISSIGWALLCFGLIGSARSIWESVFWGLLGLVFASFALMSRT